MSYKKYEIIDFHCHVFPEKIAEKATRHVGDYYSLEMHGDGTAKRLVAASEADGISPRFCGRPECLPRPTAGKDADR